MEQTLEEKFEFEKDLKQLKTTFESLDYWRKRLDEEVSALFIKFQEYTKEAGLLEPPATMSREDCIEKLKAMLVKEFKVFQPVLLKQIVWGLTYREVKR